MAKTSPASGSIITLYGKRLIPEAIKETVFGQFVGDNNALKQERDLETQRGTSFVSTLALNLTGTGFGLDTAVDGNEESISQFVDTVSVDQLTEAILIPTKANVEQHQVGWEYSKEGFDILKRWFKVTFEIWAANQLAGNTATAIGVGSDTAPYDGRTYAAGKTLFATGNNAATAPTTNRIFRAGGAATDQALSSADTMTLKMIDAAVERAITTSPMISPVMYNGKEMYVCLVSPEQWVDLVRDSSSPVQITDINLSLLQGGGSLSENPMITAKGFEYNRTLIIENSRVPYGVNGSTSAQISTVRRALFLGKGAASFGFKGAGAGEAMMYQETKDGGRYEQITGNVIGGLKKAVYNSEDYGVIVLSTYAASHTS